MKNKKGFTLIELLAVIVILAIIMVIAVPQILTVINNSKNKAWDESVGLIEDAIELNTALANTGMAEGTFTTLSAACGTNVETNKIIKSIADYDDITVDCDSTESPYTFVISPIANGQFDSHAPTNLECTVTGGCQVK